MSFVGLYTGLTGLRAAQTGIDITSHNVANAATPGYTRQRVELTARPTYQSPAGPIGTGVDVAAIGRLRDSFLDTRVRAALADGTQKSILADTLASVEALTSEPDDGLSSQLTKLWAAAESWANDPADPASRRQVLNELGAISDTFNSIATQWDTLAGDTAAQRDTEVGALNRALGQLEQLNATIANADPARIGPDLLDQRDVLLDQVAELTGATVSYDAANRARVELDGVELLGAGGAASVDPATLQVTPAGGTPQTVAFGGVVAGLTSGLDAIAGMRQQLDAFAGVLADAVNDVNGTPLLTVGADGARTIARATDDVADLNAGDPAKPHDNTNARAFADLRTTSLAAAGGKTLDVRFSDLLTGLAGEVRAAGSAAKAAASAAGAAATARVAEHGVSLDEEMVGLVRYQRSLEAASRVMSAVDEVLDVLVNRTGIVGR